MTETRGEGGNGGWWWWAAASSAQLAAGIVAYRRGSGDGAVAATVMPLKAFSIATLFVGAGAAAAGGALQATGIHSVDDMNEIGLRVRRWMTRVATNKQD